MNSSSSENEAATFRELLEKVVKLEEATPNKQLKSRTKNDREEAEIERSNALSAIDGSSSDESKSSINDDLKDDFEFGPKKARKPSNPKKDLIKYLEKKSKDEIATKREELRIREKELDITRLKAEADIEERKKMTELLMKLATQKP
ncbi:hypothetical protein Bhyg_12024 [Pseudolycoriella hygida]|uniref:Uncharacterized protein n=1 Tax=Pseudolycoriella hygida TaxID=35572 RepID=A0A9Q0MWG8_9DIPT|nr:hypothetical protein Bhyg_12024 [Pseudolycoriella hygida]